MKYIPGNIKLCSLFLKVNVFFFFYREWWVEAAMNSTINGNKHTGTATYQLEGGDVLLPPQFIPERRYDSQAIVRVHDNVD